MCWSNIHWNNLSTVSLLRTLNWVLWTELCKHVLYDMLVNIVIFFYILKILFTSANLFLCSVLCVCLTVCVVCVHIYSVEDG